MALKRWIWIRLSQRRSGDLTEPNAPALSTWQQCWQHTTRKGLPAFSIYGHDVQDAGDTNIPEDVKEKLLRFARAGLAAATMRGKSYLSMGGVSMGIAGSIVDQPFFESYLGMRVEAIDMTEFLRRIEFGIYDPEEFKRAMPWVKENCKEGREYNPPEKQRTRAQKDQDWEKVVKMAYDCPRPDERQSAPG